jgi:hypothetical protein
VAARQPTTTLRPRPVARLSVHVEARSHVAARRRKRVVAAFADAFAQVIFYTLSDNLITIRGHDDEFELEFTVAPRVASPRLFDIAITIELWLSIPIAEELLAKLEALLEEPGGEPDFWCRLLRQRQIHGVIANSYTIKAIIDGTPRADRRGRLYLI